MSQTPLKWYKTARGCIESQPGVSAQIQAHLLLELCMKALPDGHIPTARTRDVAEWLMVSKPTAKKVIQALVKNQIIENVGGGSLQLCMCDNVGEKESQFQNVGKNESELPQNFQNVGKKETQFQNVGKNESDGRETVNPDNILISPINYVNSREETRTRARTRGDLAPTPTLSPIEVDLFPNLVTAYCNVFERKTDLSTWKLQKLKELSAEHGCSLVIGAIERFDERRREAQEDGRPWSWDRGEGRRKPVPMYILSERIAELKSELGDSKKGVVAATQSNGRRRGNGEPYKNDAWNQTLREEERNRHLPAEKPTDWREVKWS